MLRLAFATLLIILALPQNASARNFGCSPATTNWSNGSGQACPYDSGGSASDGGSPTAVVETAPPPPTEVTVCLVATGC